MSWDEDTAAQAAQEEADRKARAESDAKQAAEEAERLEAERLEAERLEAERQRVAAELERIEEAKKAAMEVANQQRDQAITAGAEVVPGCGVRCLNGDGYCGLDSPKHPMPHQCPNGHTWGW